MADELPSWFPAANRLALELECLLLDTKDMPTVSRWWDSAHEALTEWRKVIAQAESDWAAPDCPNCVTPWKCNGPHEPAALPPGVTVRDLSATPFAGRAADTDRGLDPAEGVPAPQGGES